MKVRRSIGMACLAGVLAILPVSEASALFLDKEVVRATVQETETDTWDGELHVLLKTSNYSGVYHSSVTVTATKAFTISNGKKTKKYKAKKRVTLRSGNSMFKNGASVQVDTKDGGKIKVTSIKRSQGVPAYRGSLTIKAVSGKGLAVINDVDMDSYLYSVVESEMSSSFAPEALKAQAVTARSFAYDCRNSSTYASVGADFDDSTSYQVYNNKKESATVRSAVDATSDMVVKADGNVLRTYFFSTSFGKTGLPSEIWGGTATDNYFNSVIQVYNSEDFSLDTDEKFHAFLEETKDTGIEKNNEWYRWSVDTNARNLSKQINNKLGACYLLYPAQVQVQQKDGSFKGQIIHSLGTIEEVSVEKRANSGMVEEILLKGTSATVKVSNVTAIRMLLAPYYDKLVKQNGTQSTGLSYLPSNFFEITKNDDTTFSIAGGGYGHGIGMSQNGANQLAKDGYTYDNILKHYYKNVEIEEIE